MPGLLQSLSPADAPALQALYAACADYFIASAGSPAPPGTARSAFFEKPPSAGAQKLLAGVRDTEGGLEAMAESLCGYPDRGIWFTGLVLVRPAARGSGLGSRIAEELQAQARTRGCTEMRLCVYDYSEPAQRFWARHGFRYRRTLAPEPAAGPAPGRQEWSLLLPPSCAGHAGLPVQAGPAAG